MAAGGVCNRLAFLLTEQAAAFYAASRDTDRASQDRPNAPATMWIQNATNLPVSWPCARQCARLGNSSPALGARNPLRPVCFAFLWACSKVLADPLDPYLGSPRPCCIQ